MSTNNQFDRVNRLVEEALDIPPANRHAFLGKHCGADEALLAEAQRLLSLSQALDGFLDSPPAARCELGPGDVLGNRFVILKTIGAGGTGTVFLAEDRQLGEVALKVLHPDMRHDSRAMDRFFAEIKTARSIRHPHVCPVFDLFHFDHPRCGPIVAFTMKSLAGETLAHRLERGPIYFGDVLSIARGIASGIDALHAEGIIHRDLKPDNIMLTARYDGTVMPVVMDFGLASSAAGEAPGADISGSPGYMAPEQFRSGSSGTPADIYAFGVILFEMVTGHRPFPSEELLPAAIRRVTEEAPHAGAFASWIPRSWDGAIARALSRDPSRRPRSAGAVLDEMERAMPKVVERPARTVRRCYAWPAGRMPKKARSGYLRYCQKTDGL